MKNFKKLIGDKIYLSPKGTTDEEIEIFTQWVNDFQVTDYIGVTSGICTLASEKEYLEKMAKDTENRDFNIVDLATDKIIGTTGLKEFNWINRSASLGIFIGEAEYRSKGYGTEALNILLEYAFRYLNLHTRPAIPRMPKLC